MVSEHPEAARTQLQAGRMDISLLRMVIVGTEIVRSESIAYHGSVKRGSFGKPDG